MTKLVLAVVATFAFAGVASAADLPRRQPPPVATVGKAPIGKLPCKYPVGSVRSENIQWSPKPR